MIDVLWRHVGHANNVAAMTGQEAKLYAATSDNRLWVVGDAEPRDLDWREHGNANNVVAMAASNGDLLAATSFRRSRRRRPGGRGDSPC